MLILREQDLRSILAVPDVIDAVEGGFRALGVGDVHAPERLLFDLPESEGALLEMPAYAVALGRALKPGSLSERGALGTKIVSVFRGNAQRGIDSVQSVYLLLDSKTGEPLALMEGRFLTAIRTAATSSLATRHMASPGPRRLAVFGAGVQAQFHIDALVAVEEIESVMLVSRTESKAAALAARVRSMHRIPCRTILASEALAQANLICTCTTSETPLFDGGLLRPGTHINAVGAFTPRSRELDTDAVRRARVIIDAHSAAGREAGEILIPISEGVITAAHMRGTLSDVVLNRVAGRESGDEITIFKSSGLAVEDLVTAQLAYDRARSSGIGTEISLG
jgi:alanine dehydrogenase